MPLISGLGIEEGAEQHELVEDVAEIVLDSLGRGGIEQDHQAAFAFPHLIDEQSQGGGLGMRIAAIIEGICVSVGLLR